MQGMALLTSKVAADESPPAATNTTVNNSNITQGLHSFNCTTLVAGPLIKSFPSRPMVGLVGEVRLPP